MKKIFLLILASLVLFIAHAQEDTSRVKGKGMQGLGLTFGYNHAIIHLESSAMFIPNSDRVITAKSGNAAGASAGITYEYRKNNFSIRPAAEAAIIFAYVEYDVQRTDKEEGWIFPFTIDIPVHFMYHPNNPKLPSILVGPRALIPISAFNGVQPPQSSFGFNVEGAISFPIKLKSNTMRLEAGYSFGLNDLLKKESGNEYTEILKFVRRDLVTFKLYFN